MKMLGRTLDVDLARLPRRGIQSRCFAALVIAATAAMAALPRPAQAGPATSVLQLDYQTEAGVIRRGNILYGVVTAGPEGDADNCGYVFKVGTNGSNPVILHDFEGGPRDGCNPMAELVFDEDGALYGTASEGGLARCPLLFSERCGIVFKLTPRTAPWRFEIIHKLRGSGQGSLPVAPLVFGHDGELYGTTRGIVRQGADSCDDRDGSTVFRLTPPDDPGDPWTHTRIYEASLPVDAPVVFAPDGSLYGTEGGSCINPFQGRIFRLVPPDPPATGWTRRVLHTFNGAKGAAPFGGLLRAGQNVFYGATAAGGTQNKGTVYRLTKSGSGWTHKVLFNFTSGGTDDFDPGGPRAELVRNPETGDLYGTTAKGGVLEGGTAFRLRAPDGGGTPWELTELYGFSSSSASPGDRPLSPLIFGNNPDVLYGTTSSGNPGAHVFRVPP